VCFPHAAWERPCGVTCKRDCFRYSAFQDSFCRSLSSRFYPSLHTCRLFSGGGPYVQQSHICARRSVLSASSNTVRMSLVCSLEACPADTQSALAVWVSELALKVSNTVFRLSNPMRRYDDASCLVQKLHCSSAALLAPVRPVRELFECLGYARVLATMRLRLFWTSYTAVRILHCKLNLPQCTCS